MEQLIIELEGQDYIELKNLLKITGIVQTGGQVKILLEQEKIIYNNEIAFQKKKKCFSGDVIKVDNEVEIIVK